MGTIRYKDLKERALQQGHVGRKKIAFVLASLSAGGAERVLITLMNGLDRGRFEPHFIVVNENGSLRNWIAGDIPVHPLGNRPLKKSLPQLARALNRIEPDIIVSTMAAMNYSVLLAKPFLRKKARIIVREAVIPSSIAEAQRFPWLVKQAYRLLYPRADLVVSPARCIIEEFRDYLGLPIHRHALLHNPVDFDRIRTEQIIQPAIDRKRLRTRHFIAAGRLHPQKGFDRLIEALAPMDGDDSWTLAILGEGQERAKLEKLVKDCGLEERISLPGLSTNPWPQIGAADAFLLPSRWEGLPNVALESLCVGTPVIAMAEAGGISEIARLTEPGAVTIAATMEAFIAAMCDVRPHPHRVYRPSLLPGYFHLPAVIERFSDLLEERAVPLFAPACPEERKISRKFRLFGRNRAA